MKSLLRQSRLKKFSQPPAPAIGVDAFVFFGATRKTIRPKLDMGFHVTFKSSKSTTPSDRLPTHLASGEYTGGCVGLHCVSIARTQFLSHHATPGVFTGG